MPVNVSFIPDVTPYLLPQEPFNALILKTGARVAWSRSHTCPCIYGGGQANGALPFPGSADPGCLQCFGTGVYWDAPTQPFMAGISFMHLSPSPDEPGVVMNDKYGPVQTSEPSLTLPYLNPENPAQPLPAWEFASTDDLFALVDMLSRFTAVLQVGGIQVLPYQQNLQIAPQGAVTVYNSVTHAVIPDVPYDVSGAQVTIDDTVYPVGTSYMVEFSASPLYVVWRRAGGLPHVRPFGGGIVPLPRRFRLQTLDFWTRQRMNVAPLPSSTSIMAAATLSVAGNITGTLD